MSTMTACSPEHPDYRINHHWQVAKLAALAAAEWACVECGATDADVELNVHHSVPVARDGTGYDDGCQHHQTNLEVLCVVHHRMRHRAMRAKVNTQLALFAATAA